MPWARVGDNAATYPALMELLGAPEADERTINEVTGFLFRCGFQSAGHTTDYVIDMGTAYMIGGSRTPELIRLCESTGLLTPATTKSGAKAWILIADPEFIHIRLKAEIDWSRQQARDTKDLSLKVPVSRRDGDQCRWCGVLVMWRGRLSKRTGTYDHLKPGKAGTVDTMVVACSGCNSARGGNVDLWDDNHTLRTPPTNPRYGKWTAELLTDNGWPTEVNVHSDDESATTAAAGTAPKSVRPAAPKANRPALASSPSPKPSAPLEAAPATSVEKSPDKSTGRSLGSTYPGSGRDGSGYGSGDHRDGAAASGTPGGTRRRRGKRGGKSKTRTTGSTPEPVSDVPLEDPPEWAMNEMGAAS